MGTIRQMKRSKKVIRPSSPASFYPLITTEEAYNHGFHDGAKQQREADINNLVNLLEGLESIKGIGDKKAMEIRMFFLGKFDKWER